MNNVEQRDLRKRVEAHVTALRSKAEFYKDLVATAEQCLTLGFDTPEKQKLALALLDLK